MILLALAAVMTTDDVQPATALEIWLRFAGTIAAIIATGFAGWLATRRSTSRLEETAEAAKQAAESASVFSEPLGAEGLTFTQSVLASLADLKQGQVEQGQRLTRHLEDHASSDLRRPHRA